jgi:flagellar motor component MotA
VLPSHPVVPTSGTAATDGPRGRILTLVLTGLVVGVVVSAADHTAGLALAVVVTVLGAVAFRLLRSRRTPARRDRARVATTPTFFAADDASSTPDELTQLLRRLYDDHVEQVNMALSEDREDLAQQLSDDYIDQALRLITAGAQASPDWLPAR